MNEKPSFHYEISFPDFEPSEAVRTDVERYLAKVENLYDRVVSCHVSIRAPHQRQRVHIYHVTIVLEIPGEDVVVSHEPEKDMSHADIHVAIRDAFNALTRQLRKRVKSRQEKVIVNEDPHEIGVVKSFDPNQGWGFVEDHQGREIYFHQNALLNADASDLKPGSRVRFVEGPGEKGNHVTSMSMT